MLPPLPTRRPLRIARLGVVLGAWILVTQSFAAPTVQYSHGDPTGVEQYTLELINRARLGPPQEGVFLTTQTATTIRSAYTFFNVNVGQVQSDFSGLAAAPPLAMNAALLATARAQSQDMQTFNYQDHTSHDGRTFVARIQQAGYFGSLGENIYSFVPALGGALFAHTGFNIDWGVPNLEHREAIMGFPAPVAPAVSSQATWREIGVGLVQAPANAPQHANEWFVTHDFGEAYSTVTVTPTNIPFLVGVVYTDLDADGFYNPGEGAGGITVMPAVGLNFAVTSASGGYAIPLQNLPPGTTSINLTFSGGALGTRTVGRTVTLNGTKNVKVDVILQASTTTRLVNLATRLRVETGSNVGIGGFVVAGTAPKQILVRAIGPSLTAAGVSGAMSNPTLQIFDSSRSSFPIAQNDDWQSPTLTTPPNVLYPPATAAQISATGFPPADPRESVVLLTLSPGAYTGIVSGVGGEMGVALIEVYDVSLAVTGARAINVATRGRVLTDDAVMIAGFVIQGDRPRRVIIRALGPSLAAAGVTGVLANPSFQLFAGPTPIASNDDWKSGPSMAELQTLGRAPSDDREAALIVTLAPGAYTAIVSGVNRTTGVALVEVYDAEE